MEDEHRYTRIEQRRSWSSSGKLKQPSQPPNSQKRHPLSPSQTKNNQCNALNKIYSLPSPLVSLRSLGIKPSKDLLNHLLPLPLSTPEMIRPTHFHSCPSLPRSLKSLGPVPVLVHSRELVSIPPNTQNPPPFFFFSFPFSRKTRNERSNSTLEGGGMEESESPENREGIRNQQVICPYISWRGTERGRERSSGVACEEEMKGEKGGGREQGKDDLM